MERVNNPSRVKKVAGFVKQTRIARSVSTFTLVQTVIPFFVVAALGLTHIYLNFSKTDMVIQLTQLQNHKRRLIQEQGRLVRENEALTDSNRLKAYAVQDLKMIEIEKPSQNVITVIPDSAKEKYLTPLKKSVTPLVVAQEENLTEKFLRLVGSNKATAAPVN